MYIAGIYIFLTLVLWIAYDFFAVKEAEGRSPVYVIYRMLFAAPVDAAKLIISKIKNIDNK